MNHDELMLRQQRLLLRSTQLRLTLAGQLQIVKKPLAAADRAQIGLQWLYRNPQWPLTALLVLIVVRPERTLRWAGRLWWAWKAFKRARSWITPLPLERS